jgi:hypothetical protein
VFATRLETRPDHGLNMENADRMLDSSKEIKVGMPSKDPPVLAEHEEACCALKANFTSRRYDVMNKV